uniref:Uncharacterized protein n=1 Tax=Arundo donax TaxID=35708 RepID=A0A0A9DD03_ARUDO
MCSFCSLHLTWRHLTWTHTSWAIALGSLLATTLINRRQGAVTTVGVDDVVMGVCVQHGHMGHFMTRGWQMTKTWPTCTSWSTILLGVLTSVEVLTISLKEVLHTERHPKCGDYYCYLNMIREDPLHNNFVKAPIFQSVIFSELGYTWFILFIVRAYPDSSYQSEKSKNVVRRAITTEELEKFLLAVAVS